MAIPPLVLRIVADSSGVTAGVAQAQAKVGRLRGFMARNSAMLRTGALVGAVAVAKGLQLSFQAAKEAQEAQLKLANSIKNSETVSKSAAVAFTEQADAIRRLTGVDDEAIVGAQAFLVQMGLTEEQVSRLTPLVVDLSAKMDTDLNTVAKAVGKSVNGTTAGLQRMGVVVDQTKAKTDPYAATVKALGVAQGFANRQAQNQPWKVLGSEMEELGEKVGKLLIPFLQWLARLLITVVDWINTKFVPAISKASEWVRKHFGPAFQAIKGPVLTVLRAIFQAVQAITGAIVGAITKLDELIRKIPGTQGGLGGVVKHGFGSTIPGLGFILDKMRAQGGPVMGGQAYMVGERGPELFIPRNPGTIAPTGEGTVAQPINIYLGDEMLERVVVKGLTRAAARA